MKLFRFHKHLRIQIHRLAQFFHNLFITQSRITLLQCRMIISPVIVIHILHFNIRFKTNILCEAPNIPIPANRKSRPTIIFQQIHVSRYRQITGHLIHDILTTFSQSLYFRGCRIMEEFQRRTRTQITQKYRNQENTDIFT